MTIGEHERTVELFGSEVRILIGAPVSASRAPALAAMELEALLRMLHRLLTRFDASSELSRLNADPLERHQASPLLVLALRAGLWSAEETSGLVDPTLVGELEQIGYASSRAGVKGASLDEALRAAPPRRAARPRPEARWREFSVDALTGVVQRPPGVRFDTGGSGKGLAADLCAGRLEGFATFVVDAGGDLRIGGEEPPDRLVEVDHPLQPEPAHVFSMARGAVATSGIATRIWRRRDGFAHHLLDPSTGQPAWTGVIQATAIGETALEAETLAKAALLSGPERGAELLEQLGGVLVLDDGAVLKVGAIAPRPQAPAPA